MTDVGASEHFVHPSGIVVPGGAALDEGLLDPRGPARWIKRLLWCIFGYTGFMFGLIAIGFATDYLDYETDLELEFLFDKMDSIHDFLVSWSIIPYLLLYVACGILWLVWIYRIARNTQTLNPDFSRLYGPRLSVALYFIPLVNLIIPLFAMRKYWRIAKSPKHPKQARTSFFIWAWWPAWICMVFFLNAWVMELSEMFSYYASAPDDDLVIIFFATAFVASFIALFVVRRLTALQARHLE